MSAARPAPVEGAPVGKRDDGSTRLYKSIELEADAGPGPPYPYKSVEKENAEGDDTAATISS